MFGVEGDEDNVKRIGVVPKIYGDVTLNRALPLAAWASPTESVLPTEYRSVMFTRPRRGSGSLHITSLVFPELSCWDAVRPRLIALLCRRRLIRHTSHIPLRGMFVAVDRTRD